jgi:subtilase family serine protease
MGLRPLPDVMSLSWGSAQPAPTGADQIKELLASDTILAKMAAMGVTVVAASGDYGNYGTAKATCDGKHRLGVTHT